LCEKHAVNDSVLLTNTGGVFIKLPFNNFKKALGKNGKLNKHNNSASHIRSIEQKKTDFGILEKSCLLPNFKSKFQRM